MRCVPDGQSIGEYGHFGDLAVTREEILRSAGVAESPPQRRPRRGGAEGVRLQRTRRCLSGLSPSCTAFGCSRHGAMPSCEPDRRLQDALAAKSAGTSTRRDMRDARALGGQSSLASVAGTDVSVATLEVLSRSTILRCDEPVENWAIVVQDPRKCSCACGALWWQ